MCIRSNNVSTRGMFQTVFLFYAICDYGKVNGSTPVRVLPCSLRLLELTNDGLRVTKFHTSVRSSIMRSELM